MITLLLICGTAEKGNPNDKYLSFDFQYLEIIQPRREI